MQLLNPNNPAQTIDLDPETCAFWLVNHTCGPEHVIEPQSSEEYQQMLAYKQRIQTNPQSATATKVGKIEANQQELQERILALEAMLAQRPAVDAGGGKKSK